MFPRALAGVALVLGLALSSCNCGGGGSALDVPNKLRVKDLDATRRGLLRATLEIEGLLAPTELSFDAAHEHMSGSFVLAVEQTQKATAVVRVFGRFTPSSREVLVGLGRKTLTIEPRSEVHLELAEGDWQVDGTPIFDDNGNGQSNIDDLADADGPFDPAAPERVLAVLPDALQFASGVRPGSFVRQVIVVENASGLAQQVSPVVVGGQGVSITRIDPTGEPEGGAPRSLEPFVLQPFQEVLLAVTFAPTNELLVRGTIALSTLQPDSGVRSVATVGVIANSDGEPKAVEAGYDPGTVDAAALGLGDLDVIEYPAASLFGGQPIAPGAVQLSSDPNDVVLVPRVDYAAASASVSAGVVPAGVAFLVAVPPRNRLSVTLDALPENLDLALLVLDAAGAVDDASSLVGATAGLAPEGAQLRNPSSTEVLRALIVLGRVDAREPGIDARDDDDGVAFSLLAQLDAGPEFADPSLSRFSGDFRGGNDLELFGIDFRADATVLIGGHIADRTATTTSADGTSITTVTPPASTDDLGARLTVVAINTNGEAATLPQVWSYDSPRPQIDDVDPPTGNSDGGTRLFLSGAFFSSAHGGPRVLVGEVPATNVRFVNSGSLEVTAPAHEVGFTTLVVENIADDGSALASVGFPFFYVAPVGEAPSIDSVEPDHGSTDGGEPITLRGAGFVEPLSVRIGGTAATNITVVDDGTITCRTPPAVDAGAADVVVTVADSRSAVRAGGFLYETVPPSLIDAQPDTVTTIGGTRVFVDAQGLRAGVTAFFVQGDTTVPAAATSFVSATRAVVTAPAGLGVGPVDLLVRNLDGAASNALALTVAAPSVAPPRVLSVSPSSVRVDALNLLVTVTGTGFQPGMLAFLDAQQLDISALTSTGFQFQPPQHAPGAAILRVENPDGQNDASALGYLEALGPVLFSTAPDLVGAFLPGDVVTIAGANLVSIADADVHLEDGDGTEYASTLVSSSTTQLRVRIDDALPERGDFVVIGDFATGTATSPAFAAVGPALLSQQALSPPVDGADFTVLLQGSSLNHTRITTVRFVRDGDGQIVEIPPVIATDSVVRVDTGGLLGQGAWTIALVYAFTDPLGNPEELAISVPDPQSGSPSRFVVAGQCGNGALDPGEDCDGLQLDGQDCTDFGFFGGTLLCDVNCHFRTTQCTRCGDGIIQSQDGEECDGANIAGATCAALIAGSTSGTPGCSSQCQLTAGSCATCGNGIAEGGEQCDGTDFQGQTCATLGFNAGQISCDPVTCTLDGDLCSTCGNNRCDTLETNANCAVDCAATCGNGVCDLAERCTTCPRDCGGQCTAPFSLSLQSGGGQSARFSSDLAQPFVVHAVDDAGAPLVGVQITFAAPPGGNVSPAVALTNATGNASTIGTLARTIGAQTFTATGTGPDGQLLAGAPVSIAATSTDLFVGQITTLVNQPAVVGRSSLVDAGGNPTPVAASKSPLNLESASGIAVRPSDGAVFVSDGNNNRVVRVAADGRLFLVAGSNNGTPGFIDNVTATSGLLSRPRGLAFDAQENLYIADATNNRVRRVDHVTGAITTVAGGGTSTLESVLATDAQLFNPSSIVFAPSGAMFVLNNGGGSSDNIRAVGTDQRITTSVASASCSSVAGVRATTLDDTELAVDPQGRLLFIASVSNAGGCPVPANTDHLLRLESNGTLTSLAGGATVVTNGSARGAQLLQPTGLVADGAGNVYVAERAAASRRLRKVSALGVLSTLAGTTGVAASATTTGDGGASTSSLLAIPGFVALAPSGDLVLADSGLHDVRLIRDVAEDTPPVVTAVAFGGGQSAPITQPLAGPLGVTVSDALGNKIANVIVDVTAPPGAVAEPASGLTDANGVFSFVAFVGRAPGSYPFTLRATGLDGLPLGAPIVVTETATDIATGVITSLVNQTGTAGSTLSPAASRSQVNLGVALDGIALDPDDGTMFVTDTNNHRVLKITASGALSVVAGTGVAGNGGNGPALTVALSSPRGLALDDAKNLFIADTGNDVVRVLKADGSLTTFAGSLQNQAAPGDGVVATGANLDVPSGLAVGPSAPDGSPIAGVTGDLFIVDEGHNRIRRVDVADATPGVPGVISSVVVGGSCTSATGARAASFTSSSLAFDKSGRLYYGGAVSNAGSCPLPDPNGDYLFRLEQDGTQTALAGGLIDAASGAAFGTRVRRVSGIATDPAGNVLFAENVGHRVRRVDALGSMTTLFGDGTAGFTADNVVAGAGTRISSATGLAFDTAGNLYLVDGGNQRVRMVRNVASSTAASATIAIFAGDAQTGTIGQIAPLPLRVRVIDNNAQPVVNLPVTFSALDLGDTVTQPVVSTTIVGEAATTVRLGRSSTTPHRFLALARTWLDPTDIPQSGGGLPVFTLSAQRPSSGSTVAIVNSQGTPGALPPLTGFGEIAATEARLNMAASGVAIAADGTLFVADTNNHRVLSISPEGHASVFAGTGTLGFVDNVPADQAQLELPRGVAVDAVGNVYIADAGAAATRDRVRRVGLDGVITTIAGGAVDGPGHGDGGTGTGVSFSDVRALAIGPDGFIYVVDAGFDNVRRIDPVAPHTTTSQVADGGSCTTASGLRHSDIFNTGLAWDASNRLYFFASNSNGSGCPLPFSALNTNTLFRQETNKSLTYIAGTNGVGSADGLAGIAINLPTTSGLFVDATGALIYLESNLHRMRRLPGVTAVAAGSTTGTTGTVTTVLGTLSTSGFSSLTAPGTALLSTPSHLAVDDNGDVYWTEDGSSSARLLIP